MRLTAIFLLTTFLPLTTLPQDTNNRAIKPDTSSAGFSIVTKVPFNGKNYFIRIIPVDTGTMDHMPMYSGRWDPPFIWNGSLQHLLPDSILKSFNDRQKQLEQRQRK